MPLQYFVGCVPSGEDGSESEFDGWVWQVDPAVGEPERLYEVLREGDAKAIVALLESHDALQRQHIEDERLLAEAHAALSLGPIRGICSWCELKLHDDADPQALMKQHLYECVKHPMRNLEAQRDVLLAACNQTLRQHQQPCPCNACLACAAAIAKIVSEDK